MPSQFNWQIPTQQIQPFNPQEQQSALEMIKDKAIGGLGYVGSVLDKSFGGRAIRGLLGGKPRELLSILPGSDTFGLTDESQAVSGKELIGAKDSDSWGSTLGGMAVDMLLDPGSYLTLGAKALTPLGHAAKKAAVLPKTMAGRIGGLAAGSDELAKLAAHTGQAASSLVNQPLGGVAKLGPFTLGTGDTGQKIANKLGNIWDKALYSGPGRTLSSLFDPAVGLWGRPVTSEHAQRAARAAYEDLQKSSSLVREKYLGYGRQLEDAGLLDKRGGELLRQAAEDTLVGPRPNSAIDPIAQSMYGETQRMLDEARGIGRSIGEFSDPYSRYMPRSRTIQTVDEVRNLGPKGQRYTTSPVGNAFEVSSPNELNRLDEFRGIPGGTDAINRLLSDPAARAALPPTGVNPRLHVSPHADYIRKTYLGMDAAAEQEMRTLQALKPPEFVHGQPNPDYLRLKQLENTYEKSYTLADKTMRMGDIYTDTGASFFGNHPLADLQQADLKHARAQAGAKAAYDAIAASATPLQDAGSVAIPDLLKRMGLKDYDLGTQVVGATQQLMDRMPGANLANLHVPADVANDLLKYGLPTATPTVLQGPKQAWDSMTNLTKAWQTVWRPAFHLRNLATGVYQNVASGLGLLSPFQDAAALRGAGEIAGANAIKGLENLSAREATKRLAEEMAAYGVRQAPDKLLRNELAGLSDFASGNAGNFKMPGRDAEKTILDSLKTAVDFSKPGSANPLAIAGVGNYKQDVFAPMVAGREIAHATDDANRIGAYVAARKQGYSPEAAGALAEKLHYGYSDFTNFERQLKRFVPFYGFMRKNVPFMAEEMFTNPGGLSGQLAKRQDDLKGDTSFMPEAVAEGLAIPIGERGDDGTQRFLNRLGLPIDDAFHFLAGGANPLQRSLQKMAGDLNPMIKMPLEIMSGKQFFSGRDLGDLRSDTGNPLLDNLISNSPASSVASVLRTALDPRKGMSGVATNLFSPAKIMDVDMPKQEAIAVRKFVEDYLSASPRIREFSNFTVPRGAEGMLTGEEMLVMRLWKTLEEQRRQQALMGRR